jgi:hypothetical protein
MTTIPAIQVPAEHYVHDYDSPGRWSSYWVQIQAMKDLAGTGKLLEVGIGNGVVAHYLRAILDLPLTTVDIDPDLRPDHVASITDLPFETGAYTVAAACEVLEHIPYDDAADALGELRRVAGNAVISVPNVTRSLFLTVGTSGRNLTKRIEPPLVRARQAPTIEDQHYWELGLEGYSVDRFRETIQQAGWSITADFRNDAYGVHHFFILE